jgi:hypothetical protein
MRRWPKFSSNHEPVIVGAAAEDFRLPDETLGVRSRGHQHQSGCGEDWTLAFSAGRFRLESPSSPAAFPSSFSTRRWMSGAFRLSSLSDLKSNSHFMDRSRLRNEASLPDRHLRFRLRRKNKEKSCLLSARSAVLAGCRAWSLRCEAGFPMKFDMDFKIRQPASLGVSRLC